MDSSVSDQHTGTAMQGQDPAHSRRGNVGASQASTQSIQAAHVQHPRGQANTGVVAGIQSCSSNVRTVRSHQRLPHRYSPYPTPRNYQAALAHLQTRLPMQAREHQAASSAQMLELSAGLQAVPWQGQSFTNRQGYEIRQAAPAPQYSSGFPVSFNGAAQEMRSQAVQPTGRLPQQVSHLQNTSTPQVPRAARQQALMSSGGVMTAHG